MKKAVCIILTVLTVLSLCSCGKKDVSGLGTLKMEDADASPIPALGSGGDAQPAENKETPKPETTKTPSPTQQPKDDSSPAVLETERFTCDLFDVTVPKGWEVTYKAFTVEDGTNRMIIFASDPGNPNNILFFVLRLEPFFTDINQKKNLLSKLSGDAKSAMEWAPVLKSGPTAESVLNEWASMYTVWDAEGSLEMVKFKNYKVNKIVQTFEAENNTLRDSVTAAIADISVPANADPYGIYYETRMIYQTYSGAEYYTGYDNIGFVADADTFCDSFDVLLQCKKSFDFAKFNAKYGMTSDEKEDIKVSGFTKLS